MRTMTLMTLVLAAAGGCGGGSSDTPDAPPYVDAAPDASGAPRERIGWVDVYEDRATSDYGSGPETYLTSQVTAQFYLGHPGDFHRQTTTVGACTLRRYTPSSCDPACPTGLCVEPDVCEEWPTLVSAGQLTVTGLSTPVSITPQSGYYYPAAALPEELFADAATISAQLSGGDLAAATLDAGGVPPLVTPIIDRITLVPGQDHTVTWTPAGVGRVRMTLNSNNQGHGAPYLAIIECEVDDAAGAITVPAALVDAFPESYAWTYCAGSDCPPSRLRRYRAGTAPVGADQEIRLTVASQITFGVEHHP
jgi:hypothetical protein